MARVEQGIHPLDNIILRPMDNKAPDNILVATQDENGQLFVTPYLSTNKLSFETLKLVRKEMGLRELKSPEDVQKELNDLLGL